MEYSSVGNGYYLCPFNAYWQKNGVEYNYVQGLLTRSWLLRMSVSIR
jgi:hypothetical protein